MELDETGLGRLDHKIEKLKAVKYVLGVEPTKPGFGEFAVLPSFGDLAAASGRVPTPHGTIMVSWRRDGGAASLAVHVPRGTRATLGLPAASGATLSCDGKPCAGEERVLRRGRYAVCEVGPGAHGVRL